jgi:hypothetical protein
MGPPVRSAPSHPGIFIGDMSPMNINGYVRQFHVFDEYTVAFVGTD